MLPEAPEAGSAANWLRYARSDLLLAGILPPEGVLFDTLCFHAQQAIEKSLKAVLVDQGIAFRKAHSIEYLIGLLPLDLQPPDELIDPEGSAHYAVVSRYPGDYEPATAEDWQEAVRIAQIVYGWAVGWIGRERA